MSEQMNEDLERNDLIDQESSAAFQETPAGTQDVPGDESQPAAEKNDVSDSGEQAPEDSKALKIFRKVLIWLVVIALAFAAGFFVDARLRYQPEQQKSSQLQSDLSAAEGRLVELEEEIDRLSVFEERNQELREEITDLETHLVVLSTQNAVADSTLALTSDNLAEARLALDRVGRNLEDLVERLNPDQVEVVENMQQRHDLIMEELERDPAAALSDLEVLTSKLESLENALFAGP